MDAFPDLEEYDAIISNAGGCGSHLKHYKNRFDPDKEPELYKKAVLWDNKLKDIHEFLAEKGWRTPANSTCKKTFKLTYHESCHLCHGQKIRKQPREILATIPGLELIELPESDLCCGSAGIYNVLQPDESKRLLERKVDAIEGTGATVVATSNPGCHLQVQRGLEQRGLEIKMTQPVNLLAAAYREENGK